MKVVWTPEADADVDAIHAHLSGYSETAANAQVDRITARVWRIGQFPESGRVVPEYDVPLIREIIEGDYRIVYELFVDRIEIIAVTHGRQRFALDSDV